MNKYGIKGTITSLKRLLKELKKFKVAYLLSGLAGSLTDLAFNFLFAYTIMWILAAVENNDLTAVIKNIWVLVIMFLIFLLTISFSNYIFKITLAKAGGELRNKLFTKVCRLPVSWFESKHSGDTVSRLINDVQSAENAWGDQLLQPISAVISGIGSTILMFTLDWRIGLIAIGIGIISLFITTRFINPIKERSDKVQKSLGKVTENLVDVLSSYKVTRIFNLSGWILGKYKKSTKNLYKDNMSRVKLQSAQNMVNEFFSNISFIGLFALGGIFVLTGSLAFSTLMAVVQLSNGVLNMYWILSDSLTTLQQSIAGSDRVMEVLDSDEEINGEVIEAIDLTKPAINISNVTFAYQTGETVIDNILLSVKKGQTIALVGGSGSGKSTLFKLLLGFYKVDSGDIKIFDNPVNTHIESIREQIAYVPQVNYLFSGTIKENISYGKSEATTEEIIKAAKAAQAHDFIMEMTEGYDTLVGERGSSLSGGQRQRIAIARALIKDAPILLLDEATSSLDSQSESKVQKAIDELIKGRTSIIAAHRLSTIKHANKIIVLEDGLITEEGTHEELLLKNGRYAYYYQLQFRKEISV